MFVKYRKTCYVIAYVPSKWRVMLIAGNLHGDKWGVNFKVVWIRAFYAITIKSTLIVVRSAVIQLAMAAYRNGEYFAIVPFSLVRAALHPQSGDRTNTIYCVKTLFEVTITTLLLHAEAQYTCAGWPVWACYYLLTTESWASLFHTESKHLLSVIRLRLW